MRFISNGIALSIVVEFPLAWSIHNSKTAFNPFGKLKTSLKQQNRRKNVDKTRINILSAVQCRTLSSAADTVDEFREWVKRPVFPDSDPGSMQVLSKIKPCMDSQSSWERHKTEFGKSICRGGGRDPNSRRDPGKRVFLLAFHKQFVQESIAIFVRCRDNVRPSIDVHDLRLTGATHRGPDWHAQPIRITRLYEIDVISLEDS